MLPPHVGSLASAPLLVQLCRHLGFSPMGGAVVSGVRHLSCTGIPRPRLLVRCLQPLVSRGIVFFHHRQLFWSVKKSRLHVCQFMSGSFVAWFWTFPRPWSGGTAQRTLFFWPLLLAHQFLHWKNSLDCSRAPVHLRLEHFLFRL